MYGTVFAYVARVHKITSGLSGVYVAQSFVFLFCVLHTVGLFDKFLFFAMAFSVCFLSYEFEHPYGIFCLILIWLNLTPPRLLKKLELSEPFISIINCSLEDGSVLGSPAIKHKLCVISCKCVISVSKLISCSCKIHSS